MPGCCCRWVGSQQSWSKEGTVRHCQSKEASILWSYHEDTRELPGERNNARNNARCTQARKLSCGQTGKQTDATENIHLASLCYTDGGKTDLICIRCYMIILLKGATKNGQWAPWVEKEATVLLLVASWWDADQLSKFTTRLRSKFIMKSSLKIQHHHHTTTVLRPFFGIH